MHIHLGFLRVRLGFFSVGIPRPVRVQGCGTTVTTFGFPRTVGSNFSGSFSFFSGIRVGPIIFEVNIAQTPVIGFCFPTAWLFTRLIIIGEDKPLLLCQGNTFLLRPNGGLRGLYTPGQR